MVNLFHRPQRTTICVPGATIVPGAGACSRTVPLPVICTSSPAAAVSSMTLRTLPGGRLLLFCGSRRGRLRRGLCSLCAPGTGFGLRG